MKKKFKAKVSGMFDIVQLGDDTFSWAMIHSVRW